MALDMTLIGGTNQDLHLVARVQIDNELESDGCYKFFSQATPSFKMCSTLSWASFPTMRTIGHAA